MILHKPPLAWTGRFDPEDGEAALRMHHLAKPSARRALLGFACEAGVLRNQGRPGAKLGPTALRAALANLAAPAGASGFADLGDIIVEGDALEAGQEALADTVAQALQSHDRVVAIGGGHETALGVFTGLHRNKPEASIAIINLDAHFDIRALGKQGATSGTPFGQIHALAPHRFDYLCLGICRESNTDALFQRANAWGVGYIEDRALLQDPRAGDAAIAAILARNTHVYLSICLDVLAHYQAPGVSAPAARGLPLETVQRLVDKVLSAAASNAISLPVCDIVELSPPHDINAMTARTGAYLTRALLCF